MNIESIYFKIYTSSIKTIDLFGTLANEDVKLSSLKSESYKFNKQIFILSSPAKAIIKLVLPVPGGPYNK
jgi:hypothetical protein